VNTAAAAKASGSVGRIVLVSSMLSDPVNRWAPVRILLNNIRYSLMDYKFKSARLAGDGGAGVSRFSVHDCGRAPLASSSPT